MEYMYFEIMDIVGYWINEYLGYLNIIFLKLFKVRLIFWIGWYRNWDLGFL